MQDHADPSYIACYKGSYHHGMACLLNLVECFYSTVLRYTVYRSKLNFEYTPRPDLF